MCFPPQPTDSLEDSMEKGDNRSVHKGIQLVYKSIFDHLVSCDVHHPLVAPPQTKHWPILLRQLHRKAGLAQQPVFILWIYIGFISSMFPTCSLSGLANNTSPSRLF